MNKKTIILSIFVGILTVNILSQNSEKLEIGISGAAGLSALTVSPIDDVKPSFGVGYNFGWDVAFKLNPQLSFRTGINLASFKSSISFDRLDVQFILPPPAGIPEDYDFYMHAEYDKYEELFEAFFVRLPLMFQFQTGAEKQFYIAAGFLVGIPVNSFSQIKTDQLVTKGYSDFTMLEYENMPSHGFDTQLDIKSASKLEFGVSISAAIETGIKWKFNNGINLYTGIYADFGLNNIRKSDDLQEAVIYNNENQSFTFNSILHSQTEGRAMADKVAPVAFGVKIRFAVKR